MNWYQAIYMFVACVASGFMGHTLALAVYDSFVVFAIMWVAAICLYFKEETG